MPSPKLPPACTRKRYELAGTVYVWHRSILPAFAQLCFLRKEYKELSPLRKALSTCRLLRICPSEQASMSFPAAAFSKAALASSRLFSSARTCRGFFSSCRDRGWTRLECTNCPSCNKWPELPRFRWQRAIVITNQLTNHFQAAQDNISTSP